VAPEINRIFIDHAEIPGLMEAMTMAFEPEDPRLLNGVSPGDQVRFSLRQKGDRFILVEIEKSDSP
jgi:Cu/Ag efflux protein CusF